MNIKLNFTKSSFLDFLTLINSLKKQSFKFLESENYLIFYNIKSIEKKVLKKYLTKNDNQKSISISICLNEANALIYLSKKGFYFDAFFNTFFADIVQSLSKQIADILHLEKFNSNLNK